MTDSRKALTEAEPKVPSQPLKSSLGLETRRFWEKVTRVQATWRFLPTIVDFTHIADSRGVTCVQPVSLNGPSTISITDGVPRDLIKGDLWKISKALAPPFSERQTWSNVRFVSPNRRFSPKI